MGAMKLPFGGGEGLGKGLQCLMRLSTGLEVPAGKVSLVAVGGVCPSLGKYSVHPGGIADALLSAVQCSAHLGRAVQGPLAPMHVPLSWIAM